MVLDNLILKLTERSRAQEQSKLEGQVRGGQSKLAQLDVKT